MPYPAFIPIIFIETRKIETFSQTTFSAHIILVVYTNLLFSQVFTVVCLEFWCSYILCITYTHPRISPYKFPSKHTYDTTLYKQQCEYVLYHPVALSSNRDLWKIVSEIELKNESLNQLHKFLDTFSLIYWKHVFRGWSWNIHTTPSIDTFIFNKIYLCICMRV